MKTVPADFIPKWSAYFSALGSLQFATLAIGAGSLTLIIALRKWAPRLPGFLIAVLLASAIVALLHAPVETIGSRFPELPTGLPAPALPEISLARLKAVATAPFNIAFLAGMQELPPAVRAEGMLGSRQPPQ